MKRVVVTGMGVVAPNARGLEQFTHALREGISGIRPNPEMVKCGFKCHLAGVPQGLEPVIAEYFGEEDLLGMNSNMILGAIAAIDCWRDAGMPWPLARNSPVDWDTGAIIGSLTGGADTGEKVSLMIHEGQIRRLGSMVMEQLMSSAVSAKVSGILGLGGHVTSCSTACTTATEAIVEAYFKIREGRAVRVLVGGSDGATPHMWAGFDSMRILCRAFNDHPEKASRPLSATAGGFIPGAGAGILMIESLESALARGANIHAEVLGGHVNCGGHRQGGSMSAPNCEGVVRCIQAAVKEARITPREIDLINGHFTGTMADVLEVQNWKKALDLPDAEMPYVQATKSLIGHTMAASGGIESIATILQLKHGFLHPSVNSEDLHPQIRFLEGKVPQKTLPFDGTIAAKTSFAFGDVNGCVILKKWQN